MLKEYNNKEVIWVERLEIFLGYIRLHFDNERYLGDCIDIKKEEYQELLKQQGK